MPHRDVVSRRHPRGRGRLYNIKRDDDDDDDVYLLYSLEMWMMGKVYGMMTLGHLSTTPFKTVEWSQKLISRLR